MSIRQKRGVQGRTLRAPFHNTVRLWWSANSLCHHVLITRLGPAWAAQGPCASDRLLLITPAMTPIVQWLAATAEGAAKAASTRPRSEAQLVLPDFRQVHMLGTTGWNILAIGLAVCAIGLLFGLMKYQKLRNLPVHKAMKEISELI